MTQILDTSQAYLVWPNTISVTYLSKTQEAPPPDFTGVTITNVLWTAVRKDRLPSDSILLKMDRTFRMAKAVMQGIVPKEFDIIIDDNGLRWMVGGPGCVEILSWGNEYRVHTVKSAKQGLPVG